MKYILTVAACAALLTGCASYENRIVSSLTRVGVTQPVAGCMADRMVDRLSKAQLKRLANFAKGVDKREIENMSFSDMQRRFRAIGDPEIIEVVTRAGLGCALIGA